MYIYGAMRHKKLLTFPFQIVTHILLPKVPSIVLLFMFFKIHLTTVGHCRPPVPTA